MVYSKFQTTDVQEFVEEGPPSSPSTNKPMIGQILAEVVVASPVLLPAALGAIASTFFLYAWAKNSFSLTKPLTP